jgi:NADH-quinone oxidoreductase subunit G
MRVLARDHDEVDDGWLCDKGRFAYQHVHTDERLVQPLVREGTSLQPASWEKALAAAGGALKKAGAKAAALAGGETTNEEAFLLAKLLREGLGSGQLSARPGGELPLDVARALADPALQATVSDLEFAHAVLLLDADPIDDAPVWDLRIRKGVRRNGVRVGVASARPTALDTHAEVALRFAPGTGEALLVALDAALSGDRGNLGGAASTAGSSAGAVEELASFLRGAEDLVIVYGERLLSGPGGPQAARALLNVVSRLGLSGRDGAGLLEAPSTTNARGLREAGFAPGHGPGYATLAESGRDSAGIAAALAGGELSTVWLHHADPLRSFPDRPAWEAALGAAQTVIAVDSVLTDTIREHADVVFPAEAYAEKEGTITHPDGRVQRLRPAIGRPKGPDQLSGTGVRPLWQVIADVAERAGLDLGVRTGPMATKALFEAVPFYDGLTLDAIGGRGVRWPVSDAAARFEAEPWEPAGLEVPSAVPAAADGALRLGTFRSLWSSKEVDVSPSLRFLRPRQVVELSPADADRLGIREGDQVEVGSNGTRVKGAVKLRAAVPSGSVFLAAGTHEQSANVLTAPMVEVRRVGGPAERQPSAAAAIATPAAEGLSEMPPSAPLDIPPNAGPKQSNEGGGV